MIVATLVVSILAVILSLFALALAAVALLKVLSAEKSTHQIQYVPLEEAVEPQRLDVYGHPVATPSEPDFDTIYPGI